MENYIEFTDKIKQKLGIDLKIYNQAQMKGRLTSLRNKHGFKQFHTYYQKMN